MIRTFLQYLGISFGMTLLVLGILLDAGLIGG